MTTRFLVLNVLLLIAGMLGVWPLRLAAEDPPPAQSLAKRFQLPPGFVIEQVAGPPLVRYPLFACFDDRGRLYVAEGTGTNLPGPELLPKKLGRITLLEDSDGDGRFDKSTTFADQLVFPQGILWHDGIVYTASHPSIWRLQDTDDDRRADRVEPLVDGFRFTGNGCDIHGPFLGPDGRLYWTDGRHGYKINTREGGSLEGFAARIFRCRMDGSEIERLCGGGFDNPVEIIFTPGGEMVGTMDQGPGDCLLHYVEGGVYPMDHPCVSEFPRTGPLMPAVKQYSAALPVALCGMASCQSNALGPGFQNSLLTAQFNVHRVEQHRLVPDGSTYRSTESDFVTSTDYDVHFTDVLEDADGSVLIVDMGAWFNYGCPTSKIARPEVLGAIYRVRRQESQPVPDPWGRALPLDRQQPAELVTLLDDPRPKVRDQVIHRLAQRGDASVATLAAVLDPKSQHSADRRRNALWTLTRIGSPPALDVLRKSMRGADATERRVAVRGVGLWRDRQAVAELTELTVADDASLRLAAAEALGRIGDPAAIPGLFESLRRGNLDRFLEHSIVYALIQIRAVEPVAAGLKDSNPRVRQAALVALDQMPGGKLSREQVAPLLDTDDPDLQRTALEVISRHSDWAQDVTALLQQWLSAKELDDEQERLLTGLILAFAGQAEVRQLVTDALVHAIPPRRVLLLRLLARGIWTPLPESLAAPLGDSLSASDSGVQREAIATIKSLRLRQFDKRLLEISGESKLDAELRIAAWDCLAVTEPAVSAEVFALLAGQIELENPPEPLAAMIAARALGGSTLDTPQLLKTADMIATSGPLVVPLLTPAFLRTRDEKAGRALAEALAKSPGAPALAIEDFDRLVDRFPAATQALFHPVRGRMLARRREQEEYLTQVTQSLLQSPGKAERGQEVFFSKKAGCYACHRAAGEGSSVGPDLSQIGRFRTTRDLLESVVFPSSSIVPQFRSFVVTTKDGRVNAGTIVWETSDAICLKTSQLAEIHVARKDIDEMSPSDRSLMPDGLEKTMAPQELADLLEFLFHQR